MAIGAIIVFAVLSLFLFRIGPITLEPTSPTTLVIYTNSNNSQFFMGGLIKQISANALVIDQTFGNPDYTNNPNVTIRLEKWSAFVNCYDKQTGQSAQSPEVCSRTITGEEITKGVQVCSLTSMYNAEFYANKIWLYSSCGPFQNKIGGIAHDVNTTATENNANASGYLDLDLSSIKILNLLDHSLEDVTHNSTVVLKKDVPIQLQANYTNPNKDAHEYTLLIKLVQKDTGEEQVLLALVGKIGGDNGTFELSTKWQPTELRDYTMSLFALKSSDARKTPIFGIGTSTYVNIRVVA